MGMLLSTNVEAADPSVRFQQAQHGDQPSG
jgi:hypothetical protein